MIILTLIKILIAMLKILKGCKKIINTLHIFFRNLKNSSLYLPNSLYFFLDLNNIITLFLLANANIFIHKFPQAPNISHSNPLKLESVRLFYYLFYYKWTIRSSDKSQTRKEETTTAAWPNSEKINGKQPTDYKINNSSNFISSNRMKM